MIQTKEKLLSNLDKLSAMEMRTLNRCYLHPENKRCCSKCLVIYENFPEHFHIKKYYPNGAIGYNVHCRTCKNGYFSKLRAEKRKSPEEMIKHRVIQLRNRAKENNLSFNLTAEYLLNQWNNQKGLCYYTAEQLDFTLVDPSRTQAHPLAPSVDKLDPTLGYVMGNVVWCLQTINQMKRDFPYQQFIEICKRISEIRG